MSWQVLYLPQALEDLRRLDNSQRLLARKAIAKMVQNPLPAIEGGYGKPLGSALGTQLSGFLKVRLRGAALRIVYCLIRLEHAVLIVVIGARADDAVYRQAEKRIDREGL